MSYSWSGAMEVWGKFGASCAKKQRSVKSWKGVKQMDLGSQSPNLSGH